MRAGEIWKYKKGIESLIECDPDCYEAGDELVRIDVLMQEHDEVCFSHLKTTCTGILPRVLFINDYERVYDESR